MTLYLDSSAIVKLVLPEDGSDVAMELWTSEEPIATSAVSRVELSAAVGSALRSGRISSVDVPDDARDGELIASRAFVTPVVPPIVAAASELAFAYGLRALDAIHVASALDLREARPVFVSWDERQRQAAAAEGLPIYPRRLPVNP